MTLHQLRKSWLTAAAVFNPQLPSSATLSTMRQATIWVCRAAPSESESSCKPCYMQQVIMDVIALHLQAAGRCAQGSFRR